MKLNKKKAMLVAVAAGVALAGVATTVIAQTAPSAAVSEHDQLRALYRAAKAEGGKVTVYMGGDAPGQWDSLSSAFEQRFPGVKLHLVTDLSKYHDARIDNQLAGSPHLALTAAIDVPSYPRSPAISTVASRMRRRDSTTLARWVSVNSAAWRPRTRSSWARLRRGYQKVRSPLPGVWRGSVVASWPVRSPQR